MPSTSDLKVLVAPVMSLVFVAGGGWYTLEAMADESAALSSKVEDIERQQVDVEVLEVKVVQVEKRLEKMEELIEKTIEIQQLQMRNQAAICQATNANCR